MSSQNTKIRKLAAIVFTDIAGFTKLSSQDEEKAYELIELQRKLLKPIVEEHEGDWLKEIGDGLLLSFPSSKLAVNCAIKIQQVTRDIDGLNLRIGVHQGDILFSGNDVFGDDVNIAARMEPFAAVGGIAISNKVNDDISSSPEIETKFVSQPNFKGVRQEVKVYCIVSHGLPKTDITKVTAKLEKDVKKLGRNQHYIIATLVVLVLAVIILFFYNPIKSEVPSVAILVMENMGQDDDQFWARGLTEDLIVKIARTGEIRVTPIRAVAKIDPSLTLDKIAQQLKVRYLLTSSMNKSDEEFDLRCQLIDSHTGVSKYANKWSVPVASSPKIVGKLAYDILSALDVSTNNEIAKAPTANTKAYEFYLKGKYKFHKRKNQEDLEIARGFLQKAIDLDNNLLAAQDQLGYSYFAIGDIDKAVEIYQETNKKAKELNDLGIQASMLCNFGNIQYGKGNYDNALEYYKESAKILETVKYGKLNSAVIANIGLIYHEKLDYENALKHYNKALKMVEAVDDKKSVGMNLINLASLHSDRGDIDKCIECSIKAKDIFIELEDNYLLTYILHTLGNSYISVGKYSEAYKELKSSLAIRKQLGNKSEIAVAYSGLGYYYMNTYNYKMSETYLDSALAIQKEMEDKIGVLNTSMYMGDLYYNIGKYQKSLKYYKDVYRVAEEEDYTEDVILSAWGIGAVAYESGDYAMADSFLTISKNLQLEVGLKDDNPDLYALNQSTLCLTKIKMNINAGIDKFEKFVKGKEFKDAQVNYNLFELFNDKAALTKAYAQIMRQADIAPSREEYLKTPLAKKIVATYKEVN